MTPQPQPASGEARDGIVAELVGAESAIEDGLARLKKATNMSRKAVREWVREDPRSVCQHVPVSIHGRSMWFSGYHLPGNKVPDPDTEYIFCRLCGAYRP